MTHLSFPGKLLRPRLAEEPAPRISVLGGGGSEACGVGIVPLTSGLY